jgi:diacylglycerol kinase (ATP)
VDRKKIAFIINKTSGRKKHLAIEALIEKNLDNQKFEVIYYYSQARFHCTTLAAEAAKVAEIVVAIGGDGTVNEVASALINTEIALGIIPAGSGNGIARNFGIPVNFEKAIKLFNNYKIIKSDTGSINGTPFLATAGCGFDAHVANLFALSKVRGLKTYVKIVLNEFRNFKPIALELNVDGKLSNHSVFLATVANGKQFGNNAFIAPHAEFNDGLFNITLIKPFPLRSAAGLIRRLFSRNIYHSPLVEHFIGKEITIRQTNKIAHFDGEPLESGQELSFKINPLSLKILVGV